MKSPNSSQARARPRFIHLGERLLAIGRIRSGAASIDGIAAELDVDRNEVANWIQVHEGQTVVSLDELREGDSPEKRSLARRARRLSELVTDADRLIRELHQEYVLMLAASAKRLAHTKEFE